MKKFWIFIVNLCAVFSVFAMLASPVLAADSSTLISSPDLSTVTPLAAPSDSGLPDTLDSGDPATSDSPNSDSAQVLLRFYAINAGYKSIESAQNYDFIELERTVATDLSLADFSIIYFNSANKQTGEITFTSSQILTSDRLVLNFAKSPQAAGWEDSPYLYYFSSSGLASTAGRLQLLQSGEVIDELCWGKITCATSNPKFSTQPTDNLSLVRSADGYIQQAYYPALIAAITENIIETEPTACQLIITEIYSYYRYSATEQFVEFYNPTNIPQDAATCVFRYKNTSYPLTGSVAPDSYFIYQSSDLILTRNPSSYNLYSLGDLDVLHPHGQKKGTSYALFNIGASDEQ